MRRLIAAIVAAASLAWPASAASPGSVPEPPGLYMGALPGYTPSTLTGATVVDAEGVAAAIATGKAVLIDVAQPDRKPAGFPATGIWRPQHRSIPGAAWFPGSGWGDLAPEREALLKARVLALAGGDLARPVVAFCHPDCWGSWNLGKRLLGWGFRAVLWFPQGLEGWQEADKPTAVIAADPEWAAATKPEAER